MHVPADNRLACRSRTLKGLGPHRSEQQCLLTTPQLLQVFLYGMTDDVLTAR